MEKEISLNCPVTKNNYSKILMAHGGGGRLMHSLIENYFFPAFKNNILSQNHDGALLNIGNQKIAFTTDSYVVKPIFFPGGNIGSLAVHGTINDLAMCGAKPLFLSAGFIIEEGFEINQLKLIIDSMKTSAESSGIKLVTGDTKVVEKGKGDGIFINTSGIGIIETDQLILPSEVRPGDKILINGDIGRHGIAIISKRENLEFESEIESDSSPVSDIVQELLSNRIEIHCMRDPTRGGLATSLNEIAYEAKVRINIFERNIPVRQEVQSLCEILGFDPLYIANEGKFIAFVKREHAEKALKIMKNHPLGKESSLIGEVMEKTDEPVVTLKSSIGTFRIIDMLSGEQLPRIC